MSERVFEVRRGEYRDSGALMRLSRALAEQPGVTDAAAIMATPRNVEQLVKLGFAAEGELPAVGPSDLLVVVVAQTRAEGEAALGGIDAILAGGSGAGRAPRAGELGRHEPTSLEEAVEEDPEASLAVLSVPGPFAAREARRALASGLDVFLFSNGVSLEDEVFLKRYAAERGRLVMGPDCGTAVLDGVPIGFANHLKRGPVGFVGASGTGLQELTSLLSRLGLGTAQAYGTGGRDLSLAVGGATTLEALRRLVADPAVEALVLVSKPPAPEVAERVLSAMREAKRPAFACLLGETDGERDGVVVRGTIEGCALAIAEALGVHAGAPAHPEPAPLAGARLVGLYTGGTLAYEALTLADRAGLRVASNLRAEAERDAAHRIIDLGDDEYTRGRPHPMIDPETRAHALRHLEEDADLVLLVDCVLGTASHVDPAGALAAALVPLRTRLHAAGKELEVHVSVTGTEGDAQRRSAQVARLEQAGAHVAPSNAAAVRAALSRVR